MYFKIIDNASEAWRKITDFVNLIDETRKKNMDELEVKSTNYLNTISVDPLGKELRFLNTSPAPQRGFFYANKKYFEKLLCFSKSVVSLFYQFGNNMTTIIKNTEIKITFTSGAWYVESLNGHCFKRFNTEKKAMKYFEKLSYQMGL